MYAYILGLAEDADALSIETKRGGDIAIDGDVITSFDDEGPLIDGTAAGYVSRERTRPVVGDDAITTTTEETSDHVAVDYLADCGAGYVGIDSSDGEFLWDYLGLSNGTQIERAAIDVDAFADRIRDLDAADVWQVGYTRRNGEEVAINYHADADLDDARGTTQLGFEASFPAGFVRGTVAGSGYVALYDHGTIETVATWLRDEILPHAEIPDDDQQTLDGGDA